MAQSLWKWTWALLLGVVGCQGEKKPPLDARPVFPVIFIYEHESAWTIDTLEGLSLMRVERYIHLSQPPVVIDSQGAQFEMREIEGQRGSLWMMINPTGLMPLKFNLVPVQPADLEKARQTLLSCRFFGSHIGSDVTDEVRKRIQAATNPQEMFAALDWIPDPVAEDEPDTVSPDGETETKSPEGEPETKSPDGEPGTESPDGEPGSASHQGG